jgi:hypothetical protein
MFSAELEGNTIRVRIEVNASSGDRPFVAELVAVRR